MDRIRRRVGVTSIAVGLFAALLSLPICAAELHVAKSGSDTNSGKSGEPFLTIQRAADIAQPGDVVTVHEGIYRERVNPPRSGLSDTQRITYQAAEGEEVFIRGSEVVTGWEAVEGSVWKVVLPNSFFGDFNPFSDLVGGHWFDDKGRKHHTGAVYLNGHWLAEAKKKDDLFASKSSRPEDHPDKHMWFAQVDEEETTIWAQFPGVNPNQALTEVNVRQVVFYPEQEGKHYITVRGFTLEHAATPWSPPTTEQIGLIGTHWAKGWVIEDNTIRYSVCVGITLGKYSDPNDLLSGPSAGGYNQTIERATVHGWTRDNVGSHVVRNNHISHCEQAGIVGSLGAIFSTITGNDIHDVNQRAFFGGAEIAGIKFHAAVDCVISDNHIYRCGGIGGGIWLDWMAQGTRVSGNLLHDNSIDLFLEVNHGPLLVDHNIFLSPNFLRDWSQGTAFAHNLMAGAMVVKPQPRTTPVLKPNSTKIVKLHDISCGDNRFFNNIFLNRRDLSHYRPFTDSMVTEGNVLADSKARLVAKPDGFYLEMKVDEPAPDDLPLVTSQLLGRAKIPNQRFTQADGTAYRLDTDYLGKKRNSDNPVPGPLAATPGQRATTKVWPVEEI